MSKFHSTVSRRDFIKGIGLAGAGAAATAGAMPVFHDMDEVLTEGQTSMQKRPWFVKEVDKPTIEIDLNLREPLFDRRDSVIGHASSQAAPHWQGNYAQYKEEFGEAAYTGLREHLANKDREAILANRPGSTLRDYALGDGIRSFDEINTSPIEGFRKKKTPEDRGVPKWQGTPEENANTIRTFIRSVGFSNVSFMEVDDLIWRLFYSHYRYDYSKRVVRADVDDIVYTDSEIQIPRKAKYLIYYQPQNSRLMRNSMPYGKRSTAAGQAARDDIFSSWVQNCIWGLGYQSYGYYLSPGPPLAIMTGVGEYCRVHNCISYELGILMGGSCFVTDLPLPTTKPIDMGIVEWCKICRKCAEVCPGQAIDYAKDPHWDRSTGPWNAPNDHTGWSNNSFHCMVGRWEVPVSCIQCSAVCPFSKEHSSWAHDATKGLVSLNQGWLDSFLLQMDDFFGYGNPDLWQDADLGNHEEFWGMDHQEFMFDPIRPNY
jgi:reductive dehalogenase